MRPVKAGNAPARNTGSPVGPQKRSRKVINSVIAQMTHFGVMAAKTSPKALPCFVPSIMAVSKQPRYGKEADEEAHQHRRCWQQCSRCPCWNLPCWIHLYSHVKSHEQPTEPLYHFCRMCMCQELMQQQMLWSLQMHPGLQWLNPQKQNRHAIWHGIIQSIFAQANAHNSSHLYIMATMCSMRSARALPELA